MKINGAIFDLDGTLLDSMPTWCRVGSEYLISRGLMPERGLDDKFKAMTIVQGAEYLRENYGITDSVKEIVDGINKLMEGFYSSVVKPKPGVAEMLSEMQKRGIKLCIATATDRYLVEAALKHCGIDIFFDKIFTCSEVGCGKEKPLIFENALEWLNTPRETTWVFEDALYSIRTAKRAGFKIAAIYDEYSDCDTAAIKELCDEYITSYPDWNGLKQ